MKKKGKLRTYSATFFSNAPKIFPQECHIFTTRAPETPKTLYMPLMRSSIYCLSPFDHAKFGTLQLITVMYQQQWNRISSFLSRALHLRSGNTMLLKLISLTGYTCWSRILFDVDLGCHTTWQNFILDIPSCTRWSRRSWKKGAATVLFLHVYCWSARLSTLLIYSS